VAFASFLPAASPEKATKFSRGIRDQRLRWRANLTLDGLAAEVNPQARGWLGCFTVFYPTEVVPVGERVDHHLMRWALRKLQTTQTRETKSAGMAAGSPAKTARPVRALAAAVHALTVIPGARPTGRGRSHALTPMAAQLDGTSRMSREVHVRIRGGGRGRLPPATRRCEDGSRPGSCEHASFDFLGHAFRARGARGEDGRARTSFLPAIGKAALDKISREVWPWRLRRETGLDVGGIARWVDPIVRGWMQCHGECCRCGMCPLLQRVNAYLARMLGEKHKRLRTFKKAKAAWKRLTSQYPRGFAHWAWVHGF
jgi:hypothetical protein